MKQKYSVILLTSSGDFLLEDEEDIQREEYGVRAEKPYIINEDEEAHRVKAKQIFVPYQSLENIQYGEFEHETVELQT